MRACTTPRTRSRPSFASSYLLLLEVFLWPFLCKTPNRRRAFVRQSQGKLMLTEACKQYSLPWKNTGAFGWLGTLKPITRDHRVSKACSSPPGFTKRSITQASGSWRRTTKSPSSSLTSKSRPRDWACRCTSSLRPRDWCLIQLHDTTRHARHARHTHQYTAWHGVAWRGE